MSCNNKSCNCHFCREKLNQEFRSQIHETRIRLEEQIRTKQQQKAKEIQIEWAQINERQKQREERQTTIALLKLFKGEI